ncbi:hypothetical protein Tco_0331582 [Tanacetum coccineum]
MCQGGIFYSVEGYRGLQQENSLIVESIQYRKSEEIKERVVSDHECSDLHHNDKRVVENALQASHDFRWTKDHPLEQVRGNPTMPVQTRRQLATDPEMSMQDELHHFDRLKGLGNRRQPLARLVPISQQSGYEKNKKMKIRL